MPPNIDEIEYAPPFHNDLPPSGPKLVVGYDSPSPDSGPDIKPLPAKKVALPPADPLQKLLDLPILRPIPWKEGQELPPNKSSEHERVQVRSAVLLSTRGDIAENPCNRCSRGTGRFAKCVYKDGWFMGACATCQMSSKGNLCSFRLEKEAAARAKTAKTNPTNLSAAQGRVNHSPPGDTIQVNGPSMKRKRLSTEKAASHKYPRTSGYPEPPAPLVEESYTYEKTFDDDPNALLQYVFNQQQVVNGSTKRHHQQYLAERDENMQDARAGKSNGHEVRRESYLGEVGEGPYSPALPYGGRERSAFNEGNAVGGYGRETLPPLDEPLPLIDTFPRKKQKQLFAIIGSLQSGIRTSRQQTENLQKQLDSLQTILGIEPEEVEYN